MALENCEQVNTLFIQGQEYIERSLITKKFIPTNAYWGKVTTGSFPTNSGMTQRGHKLARQAPPNCVNWRALDQDVCDTNVGDFDPDHIIHNGSETYNWFPLQMDLRTDWINIESLLFNEFPAEEMQQLENSLLNIAKYVNEEYIRSHYTHLCDNKWVGLVECDPGLPQAECDTILCSGNTEARNASWQFEWLDSNGNSSVTAPETNPIPNSCRLRVALPHDQLYRLAGLSLDVMDLALQYLEYEEGEFIMDSVMMYDVVVPDVKISRQLQRQDDIVNGNYKSQGGFSAADLDRTLGVQRVINNYALRYDRYALRYNPAKIGSQPDPATFDSTDPSTWALLERVHPYKQERKEIGVGHVPNPEFIWSQFGITNFFQKEVMRVETIPSQNSQGSATKSESFPDGNFHWKNPDWDCNIKRNKGFWLASFRLASHPRNTEVGHSILHRLDHRLHLPFVDADIPTKQCEDAVTPYCCTGVSGPAPCEEGDSSYPLGENRVQATRTTHHATGDYS